MGALSHFSVLWPLKHACRLTQGRGKHLTKQTQERLCSTAHCFALETFPRAGRTIVLTTSDMTVVKQFGQQHTCFLQKKEHC